MSVLLYIDPGTGSILFSLIIGLVTTVYFVAKQAFIALKLKLLGSSNAAQSRATHTIVIYSEGSQYWTVFQPVLDELERRNVKATYLTSAENDPFFSKGYSCIAGEFIGKGMTAFSRLNFLEADICLMTTPGIDVYQLKRSRGVRHYCHLLHDVGDANCYRLFGLDYFDSVLLSGEYQIAGIRELERKRDIPAKELIVVGSTYLDALSAIAENSRDGRSGDFTVLVAPSWGKSGILSRYGSSLLDPLVQTGYRVIIRPHPQSRASEATMLAALEKRYASCANVEWDSSRDNVGVLSRANVMISDFSGVIFDYAFLFDRPFVFLNQAFDPRPYDAFDSSEKPWKFSAFSEIGREITPSDFPEIGAILTSVAADKSLSAARARTRDVAWQRRGEAGKLVSDFLVSKARV